LLREAGTEYRFLKIPGLSSSLEEVWHLGDFVSWVEQEVADLEHIILIGHSFGGQVAVRFVALHPEKVAQLVLIDPAGVRSRTLKARLKRLVFGGAAKLGKPIFRADIFRKLLYKVAREKDYLTASPALRPTLRNVLEEEIIADLPMVACPTLIIWGAHDTATPLSHAEIFHQRIKNSQLHVLPGAKHSPQFTHTQEVARLVKQFLGPTITIRTGK